VLFTTGTGTGPAPLILSIDFDFISALSRKPALTHRLSRFDVRAQFVTATVKRTLK
jgi:hypothetical protein